MASFSYCTGQDLAPGDDSWIYRWVSLSDPTRPLPPQDGLVTCYEYLNQTLNRIPVYSVDPRTCQPETILTTGENIIASQQLLNEVFVRYQEAGYQLPSSTDRPGYSGFQTFLRNYICCRFPLICQQGLLASCRDQQLTNISQNTQLASWCGCYLPPAQYETYVNQYGVNKSCVPTCNQLESIKLVNLKNQQIDCPQDICIIDDVTIAVSDSNTEDVNITQTCSNCTGQCNCFINDTQIAINNSQVGSINLNTTCGTAQCYDATGQSYPCGPASMRAWLWFLLLLIVFVVVLVISVILVSR